MKKRIKIIVILSCVFLLSMAAFVLSSCKLKSLTKDDIIENGYVYTVTLDFQGGTASGNSKRVIQVKEGSFIPEPGSTTNDSYSAPKRVDETDKISYTLEGYFRGTVDESGVLTYGEKWDFATDKVNEDNITIYAKWRKNYSIRIHYIDENATDGNKKKTTSVPVGEDENGIPKSVTKSSLRVSLFTALGYYYDEDYKQEIVFDENDSLTLTSEQLNREKTEFDIYMDGLNGTWDIIRTLEDFKSLSFSRGANVYLLCDIDMDDIYGRDVNWDVDWNGRDEDEKGRPYTEEAKAVHTAIAKFSFPDDFSGKFYGNGHVISNLRLHQIQNGRNDRNFGIFRTFTSTAEVKDVTFENATVNVNITNSMVKDYFVGMLVGKTDQKAIVKNVTVSGTLICNVTENNGVAEATEPYAFSGDNMADGYCQPENCEYKSVTVIKNGVTVIEGEAISKPEPDPEPLPEPEPDPAE